MSNDKKITIPNSGGVTVQKVNNFQDYKIIWTSLNSLGSPYPGDYSLNFLLINHFKRNPSYNNNNFMNYLAKGGVVPHIIPIRQGSVGIGTIDNPRGGKVIKVAYFDQLKKIWGKYDHYKSFTDFELNEFLTKNLKNIKNFNLETYLKSELESWRIFKLRFPNAELKDKMVITIFIIKIPRSKCSVMM